MIKTIKPNLSENEKYHQLLKQFMLLNCKPRTTWTLLRIMVKDAVQKAQRIVDLRSARNGYTGDDELQIEAGKFLQGVEAYRECAERGYLKGISTDVL